MGENKSLVFILRLLSVLLFTLTLRVGIEYVFLYKLGEKYVLKLLTFEPEPRVRALPLLPLDERFLPTDDPLPLLLLLPEFARPFPTDEEPRERVVLRPTEPEELLPTDLPDPRTLEPLLVVPRLLVIPAPEVPRDRIPELLLFKPERVLVSLLFTKPLLLGPFR